MRQEWPHLHDVDLHPNEVLDVIILIGADAMDALEILDTRKSSHSLGPRAQLYRFGWCVIGPIS